MRKMKYTRKVATVALAVMSAAWALTACSSDDRATDRQDVSAEELPDCGGEEMTFIKSTSGFLYFPHFVAESSGNYEDVGLNVKQVTIPGTSASLSALISGDADVAMVSAQSVITAINEGAPIIMVGGINRQFGSNVVVRGSIVEDFLSKTGASSLDEVDPEDRVEMLRGLRIAITEPGAGSDQLVRYLLTHAGMSPESDASIVGMGESSAILAAFAQGRVDAFALSSPTDTVAVAEHGGVRVINLAKGEYGPLSPYFYHSIAMSKRFVEQNPDLVQCVVTAVAMGEKLIAEDPEAAGEAARSNEVFESLDDAIYNEAYEANQGSWYVDPRVGEEDITNVFDFLAANGQTIDLEPSDVVNNEFAERAAQQLESLD